VTRRPARWPSAPRGSSDESGAASLIFALVAGLLTWAAAALAGRQVGGRFAAREPALAPELLVLAPVCLGALAGSLIAETCSRTRTPWVWLCAFGLASATYAWYAAGAALTLVAYRPEGHAAARSWLTVGAALLALLGAHAGRSAVRRWRDLPTPQRASATLAACLLPLSAVGAAALARVVLSDSARPERLSPPAVAYALAAVWWPVSALLVASATRLPHPAFVLGGAAVTGTFGALARGLIVGKTGWGLAAMASAVSDAVAVGLVLLLQAAAEAHSESASAAPKRHEVPEEARATRRRTERRVRRPGRLDGRR